MKRATILSLMMLVTAAMGATGALASNSAPDPESVKSCEKSPNAKKCAIKLDKCLARIIAWRNKVKYDGNEGISIYYSCLDQQGVAYPQAPDEPVRQAIAKPPSLAMMACQNAYLDEIKKRRGKVESWTKDCEVLRAVTETSIPSVPLRRRRAHGRFGA